MPHPSTSRTGADVAKGSSSADDNMAKICAYLAEQIREDPTRLHTRPAFEPLKRLFDDALGEKAPFADALRKALHHQRPSDVTGTSTTTSAASATSAAAAAYRAAATATSGGGNSALHGLNETSAGGAYPDPYALDGHKSFRISRRRNFDDAVTVAKLKCAIYDYDMQCGDAIDSATGECLSLKDYCAKIDLLEEKKFRKFVERDRSVRLIPQLTTKRYHKKKPPREERRDITHFASPTYSAKNKRTNWSLPENVERLRKAVHDFTNKTGDRIDEETGQLLNVGLFSKKVGIPEATLKGYVHGKKRLVVGCHVGGGKRRCTPFSKEDAVLCKDMLERAEQAGQKKSREEAMEYIKMLRPDYGKAQASRILDAHVLSKFGEHLVMQGGDGDRGKSTSGDEIRQVNKQDDQERKNEDESTENIQSI